MLVGLEDLGFHRRFGPRRFPRPISVASYPYPYYYGYPALYQQPVIEETRIVDDSLDPFAEGKEEEVVEEKKDAKKDEEKRLEALKAKLKAELRKELGLSHGGPYNPYFWQNVQQHILDSTLPYVPTRVVSVKKIVSPQAAELDLLYGAEATGGAVDFHDIGVDATPGAQDAGFMDGLSDAATTLVARVGGPATTALALAMAAVGIWAARRK